MSWEILVVQEMNELPLADIRWAVSIKSNL